ncbi:hypothetical protein NW754_013820 [Fusarium falciforme]|nr:hypothetical protein NW754_013820 [Fusarium falciforme]
MSNYYEYEEYSSRRRRDFSPDNYSGGAPAPNPNNPGAQGQGPPPPGAPPYASTSRLDEQYGAAPPRDRMTLEPPPPFSRARPLAESLSRARGAVEDNFSNSATGIGAGLLGAVVGGLVAREASDAATRHKHKTRGYDDENENRTRLVSTILGAVAGGLGANAIANRVEDSRDRDRRRQLDWERERSYVREEEMPRYDRRRSGDRDRDSRSRDRYDRGRALPANDDEEYDFVYDDPRYDDRQPQRRRSDDAPRYRQ